MKRSRRASDGEYSSDSSNAMECESGSDVVVHQSQLESTTPTPSCTSPIEDDVDNNDDHQCDTYDVEDRHAPAANVSDCHIVASTEEGDDMSVIIPSPSPSMDVSPPAHAHHNLDMVPAEMLALVPLVQQGDGDAAAGPVRSLSQASDTDSNDNADDDDAETDELGDSVFEGDPYNADGANMYGFHYCPHCVAFATCDICHAVLRTERLLHIDDEHAQTPDHVYGFPARGMHGCTHCRLVGVCDICGFYFRDARPRALQQMPRSF